jgi:phosphate transport system substrate-binding protein
MRKATLKRFKNWCYVLGAVGLLNSCSNKNTTNQPTDTFEQGTIHISVDESFKPVIDSQIKIYEASYPQTKIIAHYKPEADCLRDLAVDSIRLVITTRGYSNEEQAFLEDSMKVMPSKSVVAFDAVAVIVHPQSADSMFTMTEIRDLLTGKSTYDLTPVFDGVKATSTVRFVMDSVLRGAPLSPKVVAAQSSQGVIDYVAKTPKAIGFLGVSWVGNKEDTAQLSFLKKIKLAHLESTDRPGGYVQPVQANIYYRRYPMVRDLTYILKERHKGLGYGFANFLTTQRGQLIFKRAYLMPAWMTFIKRDANLSE